MTDDAHHPSYSVSRVLSGMGMKRSGDDGAVPLCRGCHTELHEYSVELQFWLDAGEDPIKWAKGRYEKWKTSQ